MCENLARPAVFIDRDGVINQELGYVHRIEDFHVLPGVLEGLRVLAGAGYRLVVVTNQAGIAKGYYSEDDYQRLTQHMRCWFSEREVDFAGIYHCPHHPEGVIPSLSFRCTCRKPAPGMLLRAVQELGLDVSRSVLIGDKLSDLEAGRRAGVATLVLVNAGHQAFTQISCCAQHHAADFADATQHILSIPSAAQSRDEVMR